MKKPVLDDLQDQQAPIWKRSAFIVGLIVVLVGLSISFTACGNTQGKDQIETLENALVAISPQAGLTSTALVPSFTATAPPEVEKRGITNPIDGAPLIMIPGGQFSMGADPEASFEICEQYREDCQVEDFVDEQPVHIVELAAYWIYQHEVTNAMYRQCVEAGSCQFPALTDFYNHEPYADHPVVYVSWYSAADYCNWAGGRLPAEAEWEYAARGKDGRIFPWGDDEATCQLANHAECYPDMTTTAGLLPEGASPFGVFDMSGNAAEWVWDWYDPGYYSVSPLQNPVGPEVGELKVIRGGSWKNPGVGLRVTNRGSNYPEVFSTGVGFRCVIELDE